MDVERPVSSPDREGMLMPKHSSRGRSAFAGAAVALLIAACSATPAVTNRSPVPSLPAAPTQAPSTAASPVAAGPIAEGKYLSEPNDVAAIVARIKADRTLTESERADWMKTYSDLPATQTVGLEFSAGDYTQTETQPGGVGVGARGRYAVGDGKTLVLAGIGSFAITPSAGGFALKLVKQEVPGEVEAVIAKVLFESSPFTLDRSATQAIPDGTYVGKTVKVADILATINADKKLADAKKAELIGLVFDAPGASAFAPTLELRNGKFIQGQRLDAGPTAVGSQGTYAFPDDTSLVLQEQSIETYAVTWADGSFSLKHVPAVGNEFDAVVTRFLFESSYSLVR
jgi:hypothetical protein